MTREIELRWLAMRDKSAVVATNLRVLHDKDNGLFGAEKTSIRREAITSVQIGWKRREGFLLAGTILLGIWLFVWMGSALVDPGEIAAEPQPPDVAEEANFTLDQLLQYVGGLFSSTAASVVKVASLLAGIGMFVAFWFYKLCEIQVVGAGATIRGKPKSYEEGCKFCDFLFTLQQPTPGPAAKEEPATKAAKEEKTPQELKPPDKEWRL